jgi:Capsule assembly protein Wzi
LNARLRLRPARVRACLLILCVHLVCAAAGAAPSLPWMPSADARHRLSLLADDAGLELTLSQWPLPHAAVLHALQKLPAALPPALDAARSAVVAELREDAAGAVQATLRSPSEALAGFGEDATPGSSIGFKSPAFEGPLFAGRLGARAERAAIGEHGNASVRLEGSAIATETLGLQLQAWSDRKWWGTGWESSLVLGNNAPAMTGAGLQRASAATSESPWLAWLGPWNFEFFVARLDGVDTPARPYLVGTRLTFRPFDHLEIGLTRTAQWGGHGRPMSLRSFGRMLVGKGVNPETDDAKADDPANEMGGFDLRLRCPGSLRCAAYLQLIGEDEAHHLPSKMLGLYGLELWSADGRHRWILEVAETGCRMPVGREGEAHCAYRNHAYPQGYVTRERWLGAAVGPDSRLLTLGWLDSRSSTSVKLHYGEVGSRIASFAPPGDASNSGHLAGIVARTAFRGRRIDIEPQAGFIQVRTPSGTQNDARIGVTFKMTLDSLR